MYKTSIFMLLTWPALIILSWFAVRIALILYESLHMHKPVVDQRHKNVKDNNRGKSR
jgi:hypothetical protein